MVLLRMVILRTAPVSVSLVNSLSVSCLIVASHRQRLQQNKKNDSLKISQARGNTLYHKFNHTQRSTKGYESLLMDDFTYIPTKSHIYH